MWTTGEAIIIEQKDNPRSIANKSAEISDTNLPELVMLRDFIDNLPTFLNIELTSVRLTLIETFIPVWI